MRIPACGASSAGSSGRLWEVVSVTPFLGLVKVLYNIRVWLFSESRIEAFDMADLGNVYFLSQFPLRDRGHYHRKLLMGAGKLSLMLVCARLRL